MERIKMLSKKVLKLRNFQIEYLVLYSKIFVLLFGIKVCENL